MTRKEIVGRLKGIFPPVVTPFKRGGEVDEKAFAENLRRYTGIGLGGVLVTGSTGEAPYLTERERLRLVEIARKVVKPPELLLAGTGLESTRETIRLSREVIKRGADALLVVTPGYYKPLMRTEEVKTHYRALADGVRHPILIYAIPQFTGVYIEADTIAELSGHAHIVGLKESSGDIKFVRSVLDKVKPGFRVLVGSVVILLEALRAGAAGAVLGQSGFAPDLCVGLYEAFRQGRMKLARDLQQRLVPLATEVSAPYGVAGVKAALDLSGYHGGDPRSPLLPLGAQARKSIAAALNGARDGLDF